jgi:hypothetical protein
MQHTVFHDAGALVMAPSFTETISGKVIREDESVEVASDGGIRDE